MSKSGPFPPDRKKKTATVTVTFQPSSATDSPVVLSAQLEAPADTDLVQGLHKAPRRNCSSRSTQGPEVQLQPHFREPPRCSSRCQLAARATHSRKDRRVANAAGPRRACQKRWQPSARASDNRQCCCGRERREQLSQDLQDRSPDKNVESRRANTHVSMLGSAQRGAVRRWRRGGGAGAAGRRGRAR